MKKLFILLFFCAPSAYGQGSVQEIIRQISRELPPHLSSEHNFTIGLYAGLAAGTPIPYRTGGIGWTAGWDFSWLMHKPFGFKGVHSFALGLNGHAVALRTIREGGILEFEVSGLTAVYGIGVRTPSLRAVFDVLGARVGIVITGFAFQGGFDLILPLGFTLYFPAMEAVCFSFMLRHELMFHLNGYSHGPAENYFNYRLVIGFGIIFGQTPYRLQAPQDGT